MRYFFIYIVLLLTSISCVRDTYNFENDLNFATKIDFNRSYFTKTPIEEPKNTWLLLMSFHDKCLFYKTPYNKSLGILRVTTKQRQKCDFSKDIKYEEDLIKSFRMQLQESAKVSLKLIINEEHRVIPLYNYQVRKKFTAFSNQLKKSYFDDVFINGGAIIKKETLLADGALCHGVNIECKNVVSYQCDRCQNGSYEVIDFNCPQGGSKFCGQDKCGQKNQPACPRGYQVLDSKLPSLCFNGSPAGFCEPGLATFCNDDGILVCL